MRMPLGALCIDSWPLAPPGSTRQHAAPRKAPPHRELAPQPGAPSPAGTPPSPAAARRAAWRRRRHLPAGRGRRGRRREGGTRWSPDRKREAPADGTLCQGGEGGEDRRPRREQLRGRCELGKQRRAQARLRRRRPLPLPSAATPSRSPHVAGAGPAGGRGALVPPIVHLQERGRGAATRGAALLSAAVCLQPETARVRQAQPGRQARPAGAALAWKSGVLRSLLLRMACGGRDADGLEAASQPTGRCLQASPPRRCAQRGTRHVHDLRAPRSGSSPAPSERYCARWCRWAQTGRRWRAASGSCCLGESGRSESEGKGRRARQRTRVSCRQAGTAGARTHGAQEAAASCGVPRVAPAAHPRPCPPVLSPARAVMTEAQARGVVRQTSEKRAAAAAGVGRNSCRPR